MSIAVSWGRGLVCGGRIGHAVGHGHVVEAMVRYAILGPVELCDGERRVAVGGPRQVALLAFLLVNANRRLSYDLLIDA